MRFPKPYSLLRRQKYILISLIIYWPAIFIATHIPVPKFVGSMGMSDKTLHYLAYMTLVSLLWCTVSPYDRVNWKKAKVWIILAIIVWYGAVDEWLQGFVHRHPDMGDFKADFLGAMTGLIILTVFSFWPALLVLSGIGIFIISCLTSFHIVCKNEIINSSFFFIAYAFFVLVWVQNIHRYIGLRKMGIKWWIAALILPAGLLGTITLYSVITKEAVWGYDIAAAGAGVLLAVVVSYFTCNFRKAVIS